MGTTYDPDEIHDVASAARRAKVEPADILRWIEDGMRAKPVGKIARRGPRNYRILDKWLMAYIERESEVTTPVPTIEATPKVRGRAKVGAASGPDPIGPIPWKGGR